MLKRRGSMGVLKWDNLPDPGPRFQLGDRLGSGVCADVYEAQDLQEGGKSVAIKIQRITEDNVEDLEEEFRVLKEHSDHHNLPHFYGVYRKKNRDGDQLWFVMELCEGGSVTDLVRSMQKKDKKLTELQIAYILRETIKAVIHLHQSHVMHRDIRGSNILLTKNGTVKLVDFGLSRELKNTMGKRGTSVGSPCWMAPELVTSEQKGGASGQDAYDNRVDVWALGITAIELADAKAPFEDIHPTRALFQIVRNPPPGLYRPASWTQIFNDFIAECLEKNPENRPFMVEMVEHPFFENLPENDAHIGLEIMSLVDKAGKKVERVPENMVRTNFLKVDQTSELEPMFLEDLAAMDHVSEDLILEQLQQRLKRGAAYTFLGDVLLFLNPNENQSIYNDEMQAKYCCKSRSENVPHIYSVADCAYQDVLHHEEPQHIILSGESLSGKTSNMMHLLRHLLWLGKGNVAVALRILNGITVIHALGNACTPLNANSTRHVLHTQVTFTTTGKVSGSIFWLYQLERWRITTDDRRQGNFHLFYYFYDAVSANKELDKYQLDAGRRYRFLRSVVAPSGGGSTGSAPSDPASIAENVRKFNEFKQALEGLEFGDENMETLKNIIAAIIILGEVRFRDGGDGKAEIENPRVSASVAQLLGVDDKKFGWALVNYCVIERGQAEKRRQSPEEAEEARDALARALYSRLVDWLINIINMKLSFSRAVFGDRHMISVLDLFGFECFQKNNLEQLLVNSLNEQLQYHYTQRLFAWEMQEREEEEVRNAEHLTFYNNRPTVDLLMAKPDGVMWLVDEATRTSQGADFILESLKKSKSPFCQNAVNEFSIAHYTGKVTYDARDLPEKNRDFVPPELTETMRLSSNKAIQNLFTYQLSRTGNLTQPPLDVTTAAEGAPDEKPVKEGVPRRKSKWGAALIADKQQKALRSYNTMSRGQFSQTRRMRTATATFRAVCLEILRALNTGGTHFVRCLRAELTGQPRGFQLEVVRQQLRALGVVDTVRARQNGYPCRIPFGEFLRRYKFLAFDFDETVDETGDNCRLLMVRLKMEGYAMGKNKVFLKYYNEEYLARLYEVQVKKIIKVQAMMRAFLAKKRVDGAGTKAPGSLAGVTSKPGNKKVNKAPPSKVKKASEMDQQEAALVIQKQYRGYQARKEYGPKIKANKGSSDMYDKATASMMRFYCRRWKAHSMFQVLLLYRAAKTQDLVYFSQQVHLYNQGIVSEMNSTAIKKLSMFEIKDVDRSKAKHVLGGRPACAWKVPFRFDKIPYLDTSPMCDPMDAGLDALYSDCPVRPGDHDTWDAPLRRKKSLLRRKKNCKDQGCQTSGPTVSGSVSVGAEASGPGGSHIQTPFRRELLDTSPVMPKKGGARGFAPKQPAPKQPPSSSQHGPARPGVNFNQPLVPQGPLVKQQSWMDKSNDNRKPVVSRRNDYDNNNSRDFDFPRESVDGGPFKRGGGAPRPNSHIVELQNKGRAVSDGAPEDAPFNFQAMLRKTNYNRQSMKRNTIYSIDDADDDGRPPSFSITSFEGSSYTERPVYNEASGGYGRNDKSSGYGKNDRYSDKIERTDMPARKNQGEQNAYGGAEVGGGALRKGPTSYSAAVKGTTSQDYSGARGGNWSASGSFDNDEKRHEIAPGFVVEGDCADL